MASGRTVFFLMAILASLACNMADEGADSSSREDHGPPHNGHSNHGRSNNGHSNNGRSNDGGPDNRPPPYHQSPIDDDNQDRAFGLPNFSQLFSGFGGSNTSSPFSQLFRDSNASDPFSQIVSAFGQFIPGLGGSSSSGFPNLFSAFMPHSGRSERLDVLPGDLEANNETDGLHPHDRFFFSLFSHFSRVPIGCNYTTQAGYSCSGCREQLLCNSNNVGRIRICPFYAPYCYNGVCGSIVNATCTL